MQRNKAKLWFYNFGINKMHENNYNAEMWYRKLGYYYNPFNIKPAYFTDELVGYDKVLNQLLYNIISGNMVFFEGPFGSGKTSILQYIKHRFRGETRIAYISCNQLDENTNIMKLLPSRPWYYKLILGKKPKNITMLLDEAQALGPTNMERVKYLYDNDHVKSVVFAGTDFDAVLFSLGVKERIGSNIIKSPLLSYDDAVNLIRKRIGKDILLSDEIIKEMFFLSNNNPRKLLQMCEEACMKAIIEGKNSVTKEYIEKIKSKGKQTSLSHLKLQLTR